MLYLRLVDCEGFNERKAGVDLYGVDEEFDGLIVRLNGPKFLYTVNKSSCYGAFGEHASGVKNEKVSLMHNITDEVPINGWRYHEAHVGIGIDTTPIGHSFFADLKEVIIRNRNNSHLANNYPRHKDGLDMLGPNEFHFGIMPMKGMGVAELPIAIELKSREQALELDKTRKRIWRELSSMLSQYE